MKCKRKPGFCPVITYFRSRAEYGTYRLRLAYHPIQFVNEYAKEYSEPYKRSKMERSD